MVYFVTPRHFVFAPFSGRDSGGVERMCNPRASGRKRYNLLAALDCVSHKMIQVSNHSYINAESVCLLLRAVAGAALPGMPITLVLDNARYQKCGAGGDLAKQLGIELRTCRRTRQT